MDREAASIQVVGERLKRALRGGRLVLWEWDLGTGDVRWSHNLVEVLGGALDRQADFEAGIHPDDRARYRAALSGAFTEGLPYGIEMRFVRPDGQVIWIEDKAELQIDEAGRRILSGTTIDITQRKTAEAMAQAHAERLRILFETMQEGVYVANAERDESGRMVDFHFVEANPAVEQLTGLKVKDLVERAPRRLDDDEKALLVATYGRVLETGEPAHFEMMFRHLAGRWYELRARRLGPDRFAVMFTEITARKQVEAAAQEKSLALQATLQNMDQGLLMFDAEGRVQVYNGRACELTGIPDAVLAARPLFRDIVRLQVKSDEFAMSDGARRDDAGGPWDGAHRDLYVRERPDGTILEVRTVPLPEGGAVRTFTDITSERRAELARQRSDERFRLAIKATSDAIWDWDLPHDRLHWNEALSTRFGYAPETVTTTGQWWEERIHPDDRDRVVRGIEAVIGGSDAHWSDEYRFRKEDGTYADILDRGAMIRDAEGRPLRMVGAMFDQSHRKAAEATLRASEHQYRLLAENTGDMIVLTGRERRRRYVSPSCRDLLGFEPEELLGRYGPDETHPDDRAGVIAQFDEMFAPGGPATTFLTYRMRHKDGHWVTVEARRRLLLGEDGKPEAVLSAVRDVTARTEIEERLRQSQKMEAIGQLTGGIAHDFNNLLTVVIGNAEILREEAASPEQQELARMVLEAARRGASLTQHLLVYARRQTLRPERLDLGSVTAAVEQLLRRTIPENIRIALERGAGDHPALADRPLLETAILNLVVNAKDAMPNGGTITLGVSARAAGADEGALPPGAPVVALAVRDTGTGMPPEVAARAFEPFFTTKEVGQGSGLGLSMVYGFAQQSGGHVAIESRVGAGTSVTLLLPAITGAPVESKWPPPAQLPRGHERVLLVEDEAEVRRVLSLQLKSLGYSVETVSNGFDALDALKRDRGFDLLLTDIMLPKGMSGVEAARRARAILPGLKVLLTSGYPDEVFATSGKPDEGAVLLRKPFRRAELAAVLRQVLD